MILFWILLFHKSFIVKSAATSYFVHVNDAIDKTTEACTMSYCNKNQDSFENCKFMEKISSGKVIPELKDKTKPAYLLCPDQKPQRIMDPVKQQSIKIISNGNKKETMKILLPGFKISCNAYNVAMLWIEINEHCNNQSTLAIGEVFEKDSSNIKLTAEYTVDKCAAGNYPRIRGKCRILLHNGTKKDKDFSYVMAEKLNHSSPTFINFGDNFACFTFYKVENKTIEDNGLATIYSQIGASGNKEVSWHPIKLDRKNTKYSGMCNSDSDDNLRPLIVYKSYKIHYSFTLPDNKVFDKESMECHGCFVTSDNGNLVNSQIKSTEHCQMSRLGWSALMIKGVLKNKNGQWNETIFVDKTTATVTCKIDNIVNTIKVKSIRDKQLVVQLIGIAPKRQVYVVENDIFCYQKLSLENKKYQIQFEFVCSECKKINRMSYITKINIPPSALKAKISTVKCYQTDNNISTKLRIGSSPNNIKLEVNENKIVNLFDIMYCNTTAFPIPKFDWFINGKSTKVIKNAPIFKITELIPFGMNNVTCRATNVFGSFSREQQVNVQNRITDQIKVFDYKGLTICFYGVVYFVTSFIFISLIFHEMIYNVESIENKQLKRILNQSTSEESTPSNRATSPNTKENNQTVNQNNSFDNVKIRTKYFKLNQGDIIVRYTCDEIESVNYCNDLFNKSLFKHSDDVFEFSTHQCDSKSKRNHYDYRDVIKKTILDMCDTKT